MRKASDLSRLVRGIHARLVIKRRLAAIPVIQRLLPMYVARYKYRRFRKCIIRLQALWRGRKPRKAFLEHKKKKK